MSAYKDIELNIINTMLAFLGSVPLEYSGNPLTDADKTGVWCSLYNLRGESNPVTLGDKGEDNHPGIIQININNPLSEMEGPVLDLADTILSHFTAGHALTYNAQTVSISRTSLGPTKPVDSYNRATVSLYYYSRTTRN